MQMFIESSRRDQRRSAQSVIASEAKQYVIPAAAKACSHQATDLTVILRSRALARRLEGSPLALVAHPSRLAVKNGEHLRMTAVLCCQS
jgi:hypothetical protein